MPWLRQNSKKSLKALLLWIKLSYSLTIRLLWPLPWAPLKWKNRGMKFPKGVNQISHLYQTRWCILTLALSQQLLCHESILSIPQHESQEGEDESIQDAHNRQNVGPAHWTRSQAVLVRLLPAHPPHLVAVPTVRVDHAAQYQTHTWWQEEVRMWL